MKKLMLAAIIGLSLTACLNDSDVKENNDVERQQGVYVKSQPVPFFEWSLERHLMIELYKARNNSVTTYSYVVSPYTGKILASCTSLGYPIPATTQLTNPQKLAWSDYHDSATLPQAEPNGLYTPSSTHATWIMCLGPNGKIEPTYWEPDVLTFPRPMQEVNGQLVPVEGQSSNLEIDPTRK